MAKFLIPFAKIIRPLRSSIIFSAHSHQKLAQYFSMLAAQIQKSMMNIPEKFYAGGFLYNPTTKSVLLHKRDSNTKINPDSWAFFGGLNEGQEKPVETFIREVKEELGIDILLEQVQVLYDYYNKELETYRYVFFVESALEKSKMKLGEGAGFDWVSMEKVFAYDLTEKTERDLKFFFNKYVTV